ncbi:MAG: MmcQ/YjbR family DNA-binding protein, partial [Gammaproteobacteria bacterium]|nr:MmcQ/YjbR family DNA-binding protein [Gammaproteobacteria bacterium]
MRDMYDSLKDYFRNNPNVVIAEGKGAQGLKHKGKMFAMFYKGDLTVKLKPENVKKLIED